MKRLLHRALPAAAIALALAASPAAAYPFKETLRKGDRSWAVRALQIRVAGWYPGVKLDTYKIDGHYGSQTVAAVKAFEESHDLEVDGVADKKVFAALEMLQDPDGSTTHFNWSEFKQNSSAYCGAKANAYAGTLGGGMVSPRRTKMYVKRLMWRLEAVREKAGGRAISINSGFRSVAYNDCIGGARASQHMYGTAADARQVKVPNDRQRRIAKRSQFHGIGCYSSQTHNHLDLRIDNKDLPDQQMWWWPDKDAAGRELDEAGIPCWGEAKTSTKRASLSASLGQNVSTSVLPTARELDRFSSSGESPLPEGVD
jgi:hypothetical protein